MGAVLLCSEYWAGKTELLQVDLVAVPAGWAICGTAWSNGGSDNCIQVARCELQPAAGRITLPTTSNVHQKVILTSSTAIITRMVA